MVPRYRVPKQHRAIFEGSGKKTASQGKLAINERTCRALDRLNVDQSFLSVNKAELAGKGGDLVSLPAIGQRMQICQMPSEPTLQLASL